MTQIIPWITWVVIDPGVDWHKRNSTRVDWHKRNNMEVFVEVDTRVGMKEGTLTDM